MWVYTSEGDKVIGRSVVAGYRVNGNETLPVAWFNIIVKEEERQERERSVLTFTHRHTAQGRLWLR